MERRLARGRRIGIGSFRIVLRSWTRKPDPSHNANPMGKLQTFKKRSLQKKKNPAQRQRAQGMVTRAKEDPSLRVVLAVSLGFLFDEALISRIKNLPKKWRETSIQWMPISIASGFGGPSEKSRSADMNIYLEKLTHFWQSFGVQSYQILWPKGILQSFSIRAQVALFLKEAKRQRAQLIVAFKSDRPLVESFFMGRFSETLMMSSRIPILILPSQSGKEISLRKMALAVDPETLPPKNLAEELMKIATFVEEIHLVHWIYKPNSAAMKLNLFLEQHKSFYERQKLESQSYFEEVVKMLSSMNIRISFETLTSDRGLLQDIQQVAELQNCNVLGAIHISHAKSEHTIGSTTRQLARASTLPFFIFHKGFRS